MSVKTRIEALEKKLNPKPREYMIVSLEGKEDEAEEKKKRILEKDPDATFFHLHMTWV